MPDPRLIAFGRVVRKMRRDRDLSQEAVEKAGGLGRNQVGYIERGQKDPQLTSILGIARGLGVPASEIVRRYEDAR